MVNTISLDTQSFMHTTTRNHTSDALRTLVILLMIGSHTTRMIAKEAWIFWNKFVLLIEPFTAASFLFLVGSSLVLSYKKADEKTGEKPQTWFLKKMQRCLFLWFISFCIYLFSVGLVWPDSFILSGILATIAYSIVLYSLLLLLPCAPYAILSFTAAATILYLLLDKFIAPVYFLSDGNSPILPLTIFSGLGVIFTLILPSLQGIGKKIVIAICIITIFLPMIVWGPKDIFSYPLGRYKIIRQVEILFSVQKPSLDKSATVLKTRHYYNLRPVLIPVITAMIILFYFIAALLSQLVHGRIALRNILKKILALGRNSLDIYVFHLVLIGVFIRKQNSILQVWQGAMVLGAVIMLCYVYVMVKEKIRLRT